MKYLLLSLLLVGCSSNTEVKIGDCYKYSNNTFKILKITEDEQGKTAEYEYTVREDYINKTSDSVDTFNQTEPIDCEEHEKNKLLIRMSNLEKKLLSK